MLDLLCANYDSEMIILTQDFRRDLTWFNALLREYNGMSYYDHKPVHHVLELDACLTGLGGRWQNVVYHLPIPQKYQNLGIVHLEMVNILVALRLFAPFWSRKRILIRCDNQAVVSVLNMGKTRDPFLAACARNVWLITAQADIEVIYTHIKGRNNVVADLLSRWQNTIQQQKMLCELFGTPVWLQTSLENMFINNDI